MDRDTSIFERKGDLIPPNQTELLGVLSFPLPPPNQRKPLIMSSICLWMLAGTRIKANWYKGKAERSALIKIVLPAKFNHIIPQLWIFPLTFSTCLFQVSILIPSLANDKPKYMK